MKKLVLGTNKVTINIFNDAGGSNTPKVYRTVILKPNTINGTNVLSLDLFLYENTKYVIKYIFDLLGESITVPQDCIVEFDGGSINNGTLVGQNTGLIHLWGTNTATFSGVWKNLIDSSSSIDDKLSLKVDKVEGKELSSNDFTDELKDKLDNLADVATSGRYSDLTDLQDSIIEVLNNNETLSIEVSRELFISLWNKYGTKLKLKLIDSSDNSKIISLDFQNKEDNVKWYFSSITGDIKIIVDISNDISVSIQKNKSYSELYLTFESLEDSNRVSFVSSQASTLSIKYSIDNGKTWVEYLPEVSQGEENFVGFITLNKGEKILFKGNNPAYFGILNEAPILYNFRTSKKCDVYGNIMSLIYEDEFVDKVSFPENTNRNLIYLFYYCNIVNAENLILPATTLTEYCYSKLFCVCLHLKTIPKLPATTLADFCYLEMFAECNSLKEPPELPAITLARGCYSSMFYICDSLRIAPKLPATILAEGCYASMFCGCMNLILPPDLPATTLAPYCYSSMFDQCILLPGTSGLAATVLAEGCYEYMFNNCVSFKFPLDLPATTLAKNCYRGMFINCLNLEEAPELLAETLEEQCYYLMFYNCTSLKYVKCLATDVSATNCTLNWLENCSPNGVFEKTASMESWTRGSNGIPTNWYIGTKADALKVLNYEVKPSDWNSSSGNTQILNKPTTLAGYGITDATPSSVTDGILEKIPAAAASNNQLADKNFVNSSVSTNTSTFRGTSDAGLSEQQFFTWLLTLTKDINDYVFWNTTDAVGNTVFKRYKFDGSLWRFEYDLNNSSFTSDLWAAINSTITSGLVTKLSALPTNSELTTLLSGKVDKITGKGLSTEDYTTAEKNKLAGIAEGAEVNVQSDWNQSDSSADDYIKNKPTIPVITDKADKVSNATSGNLAGLDANGNLTDSGIAASGVVVSTSVRTIVTLTQAQYDALATKDTNTEYNIIESV